MGDGWYRLTGAAGVRMPEISPGVYHCGTGAPGWVSGSHPTAPGVEVEAKICFEWGSNKCWQATTATIRNCGDFFLYKLPEVPQCDARYCGSFV